MKRTILILTGVILAMSMLAGCSGGSQSVASTASTVSTAPVTSQPVESMADGSVSETTSASASASGEVVMTLEELSAYNGKDGMPAYVAVDGVIYDVSDVPQWANGDHYEGMEAGQDLTEEIKEQSPHGLSVLDGLPVVGRLA